MTFKVVSISRGIFVRFTLVLVKGLGLISNTAMWYMSKLLDSDSDLTKAQIAYDKLINSEFFWIMKQLLVIVLRCCLFLACILLINACLKSIFSCYTNNNGKNWEISLYAGLCNHTMRFKVNYIIQCSY